MLHPALIHSAYHIETGSRYLLRKNNEDFSYLHVLRQLQVAYESKQGTITGAWCEGCSEHRVAADNGTSKRDYAHEEKAEHLPVSSWLQSPLYTIDAQLPTVSLKIKKNGVLDILKLGRFVSCNSKKFILKLEGELSESRWN